MSAEDLGKQMESKLHAFVPLPPGYWEMTGDEQEQARLAMARELRRKLQVPER